ncbi:MAG: PIN domain-containing protein [bacterium]
MNGNKAVLDSNVMIDASKGLVSINEIIEKFDFLYLSIISYIEVLGYNFLNKKEKKIIEEILSNIPIIHLDIKIAEIAIQYRKVHKIKIPDSII